MKSTTQLIVTRLPKGQTEPVEEKFENVVEYGFPGGLFMYIKTKGKLSVNLAGVSAGGYLSPLKWIPIEEVREINGDEMMNFASEAERKQFIENVLGEKFTK